MSSKVAIVTGGSVGIGMRATEHLVKKGIHCIIASRNIDNVNKAVQSIKQSTGRDNVEGMKLDLCDFDSVRSFVDSFKAKNLPLNILVNNAGINAPDKVMTNAGIESTFAANHLGHFLLTSLLLDTLKASAPSNVVIVSSAMHNSKIGIGKNKAIELPIEDYNFETHKYDGINAYRFSKLANLFFMCELNRKLEGTGVVANAFCPGMVPATSLGRNYPKYLTILMQPLRLLPFTRSLDDAARAVLDLAIREESEHAKNGGKYYVDRKEALMSDRAGDTQQQREMWELSTRLVGL